MRTHLRTFLLSAAFALAAVSQASAVWDADCLPAQSDPIVVASLVENAPAHEAQDIITESVAAGDEISKKVEVTEDLVAAEIVVPLPEDIDLQVAVEMAALVQPSLEASEAAGSGAGETPIAEVETTGSLSASLAISQEGSVEAAAPDLPTFE